MIGEIKFALLALALSVGIVAAMQIKIGPQTIEQRFHGFVQSAAVAGTLQDVADGAIRLGIRTKAWIQGEKPARVDRATGGSSASSPAESDRSHGR